MKIPFIGESYTATTPTLNNARNINLMLEPAPPGSVSEGALLMTPGVKSVTTAGAGQGCRGVHKMNNEVYAVYGDKLYKLPNTLVVAELGTVAGSERVVMADNGTQLVIVADSNSYVYSRADNSFAEITSANFLTAASVTYVDGYFVFSQQGTNQFFISQLMDPSTGLADLTAFDATERARAFTSQGNIVAVYADHKELWIFKEDRMIEIWQNTGNVDFPFTRLGGAYVQRGCKDKHTIAQNDNTLFWVGDDDILYRADGYVPQRVSNYDVEEQIASTPSTSAIFAQTWNEGGHKFYGLWMPDRDLTYVYDITNNAWHERQSLTYGYWRVNGVVECYDKLLVTDSESGNIGELDFNTFQEYGSTMQAIRIGTTIHAGGNGFSLDRVEVLFEAGVGTESGQGADPTAGLSISKDFGRTYQQALKKRSMGKIGEYARRSVWRQQGLYKQATPKIMISDPVRRYIIDAYAEITPRAV